MQRVHLEVTGLVQGVGFRPHVYTLAVTLGLRGFVQNRGAHVFVDVEGDDAAVSTFLERLVTAAPLNAGIDAVTCRPAMPARYQHFEIARSEAVRESHVFAPPDVATCDACLRELFDPDNRRYRHSFITCSACGPRYSILKSLPYDRANTTMAAFAMCGACLSDYRNPADRRFHAQAIACPQCGPVLEARTRGGLRAIGDHALQIAIRVLAAGGIVAIKGLGGFHLACDATNDRAVATLRKRKKREQKPLAVMVREADGRRIGACGGHDALSALTSRERPIVLVPRHVLTDADSVVSSSVATGCPSVGIFLPYTPVHHLLLHDIGRPLVMTSGNVSDEPMVYDDAAAVAMLADMADLILTHDRRIHVRADDSVVRVWPGRVAPVRRARGVAPAPLRLGEQSRVEVLAVGGHLKNTFCLVAGERAFVSPHVGTLDSAAAYQSLAEAISQFSTLLAISPEVIAHDAHPDYLSTRLAHELPAAHRIAVQHHHAHVLSCVAEHRCTEPVIGVVLDGAGLGTDGAIWGGEFLVVEGAGWERVAHLAYVPLAGGDAAAREPWRMAVAHLHAAYGGSLGPLADTLMARLAPARLKLLRQMIERGVRAVPTSSMGRLFDAVSAMLGVRDAVTYEGQAAVELEAMASGEASRRYTFELDTSRDPWRIDAAPVVRSIAEDVAAGCAAAEVAAAFHAAVARMVAHVATRVAERTGIRRVALSGGVFQNARLSDNVVGALTAASLDVLEHRLVPCNDGGLSLGQALLAVRMTGTPTEAKDLVTCA